MTYPVIASIVEGHGEREALPSLLSRMQAKFAPENYVHIHQPLRIPRDSLLKTDGLTIPFERALQLKPTPTGVLILIEADKDCPVDLAMQLRESAKSVRDYPPASVVIAKYEFESWFVASARSYAGYFGLPQDLQSPKDPELNRDAKGWFTRQMPKGRPYKETSHQKQFVRLLDIDDAREASRSFDKFCREVASMMNIEDV